MKNQLAILGFVLFLLGMLSLILMLVGVQFSFLKWMDVFGRGWGFLMRLVAIKLGLLFIVYGRSRDIH